MDDYTIIFITPRPISHRTAEENVGIGYLVSVLRKNKYKVVIIDAWLEDIGKKEILFRLNNIDNILYIGFSCYRSNMNEGIEILREIRRNNIIVPSIVGGYGATFYPEDFLNAGFDYVMRGEAESSILDFTKFVEKKEVSLEGIKGISYKKENEIIHNSMPELIVDINTIPFPARDTMKNVIKRKSLVNILSSRGCKANCIFCSIVAFQKLSKGARWRERSINNFVDELEYLNKKGAKFFKVIDDSFIEPPRDEFWCEELAIEIEKRGLDIRLRGSIRADRVTDSIIKQLKRCGFFSFSCGIENGSKTALKRMGKSASLDQNIKTLQIFKKYNIFVQAGFILFDPFTTTEELEENYMFMQNFKNMISKGIFTEMYAASGTPFNTLLTKKELVTHKFSNHGNSTYNIIDKRVKLVYSLLKKWQKSHSKLYDKTIDPISAPKALEYNELLSFHNLFLEIREKDLGFFRLALDFSMSSNISEVDSEKMFVSELNKIEKWKLDFKKRLNQTYSDIGIIYDGSENPFIC